MQETDKMRPHNEMPPAANPPTDNSGRVGRLERWAFRPREKENRFLAAGRSMLRIIFIMIHEFSQSALSLRASALTYSIVLSMVPMLAMSTAILKGFGGDDELRVFAYSLIDQLEPAPQDEVTAPPQPAPIPPADPEPYGQAADQISAAEDGAAVAEPTSGPVPPQSITAHLRNAVDTIFNYVDRTNFAAIGAFGIVGLLLAVILVLSTVEEAMNAIWHTRQSRSMFRKTMDYLALLILLPISINVAIAGDAILESPRIMAYLYTFIPSDWAVRMLLKFLPFMFVILTLMVMFMFFPNVRVKTHAAFIGAVFAGIFWFVVQKGYIILQIGVSRYNAIYGSFATVPLFLIWVQLGWTFILLGATLAYAVQNRNQYYLPGSGITPQRNLQLAFDILTIIYTNFSRKKTTTLDDLIKANAGDLPGNIQKITAKLIKGGLLHQTDEGGPSFVPAAPPEIIEAREVVRLILGHEDIPTVGGQFSRQVVTAAESAIEREAFPVLPQFAFHGEESEAGDEDYEKAL